MKLRASGQDLRVTLISAGSIPGKRDIELQSEIRTWAVFGCTSSIFSLSVQGDSEGKRSLVEFTKRMHDAASY